MQVTSRGHDTPVDTAGRPLLEREEALETLVADLEHARLGVGRIALVGGEAGIGKTSLVRSFVDEHAGDARVLWGYCEALFTPRPLGPVLDIVGALRDWPLASASDPDRSRLFTALLDELRRTPTICVVEDIHWADEATLDALKHLGRRIETTPSLLILTYRDDEVGTHHPLRILLGELPSAATTRLTLAPLSREAVDRLAAQAERSTHQLHEITGGNPFYVTEVLEAGMGDIPPTVRDAVLARAGRLTPGARRLLEAVAVVPGSVEMWLLEELAGSDLAHLAECLSSGMLVPTARGVGFRHELARLAVERDVAPDRRVSLNEAAYTALAALPEEDRDLSALAHHADAAGNAEGVLRFAPTAALSAAALGSHREAADQYARALRYSTRLPKEERIILLSAYSEEAYITGALTEALDARREAIALCREVGDRLREGDNLARISAPYTRAGRNEEAEEASLSAIAVLEELPPSRELGIAYGFQSYLRMLARDNDEGVEWGERSLAVAEQFDDVEARAQALNLIGTSHLMAARIEEGREFLLQSLDLSREHRDHVHIALAFTMLGSGLGEMYELDESDRWLRAHIAFAEEHDFDSTYTRAWLAATLTYRGRWDEATALARALLGTTNVMSRITALITLGRVRARRGDPGANDVLDDALELATPGGHLQRLGHVRAARAEAAWLAGDAVRTVAEARAAYALAVDKRHVWFAGELAYWQWKAGLLDEVPVWIAEPYARQLNGDARGAHAAWAERGCVYEAARALADGEDEGDLREALATFGDLGAVPAANTVRLALRRVGAYVPRGPRVSTRENPAHLTSRELEVLELVAAGLRNAEIAERLVVSRRTVDHHVSAILRKLDARTRGEAVAEAAKRGLTAG